MRPVVTVTLVYAIYCLQYHLQSACVISINSMLATILWPQMWIQHSLYDKDTPLFCWKNGCSHNLLPLELLFFVSMKKNIFYVL